MARLEVYEVALALVGVVRPLVESLRQRDRDLAAQIKRATSSVPSNIAEGARRHGRDRRQHWLIAAGSAEEGGAPVQGAGGLGGPAGAAGAPPPARVFCGGAAALRPPPPPPP